MYKAYQPHQLGKMLRRCFAKKKKKNFKIDIREARKPLGTV